MRFKALIDGVHYDPKKGLVKIQLIANRVSLDELTSLGPQDEAIQVTLESMQTKIGVFTPNAIIDEEAAVKLKEAAERLREGDVDGDEVEGADNERGEKKVKWHDYEGPQDDEGVDGDTKAEYEDG